MHFNITRKNRIILVTYLYGRDGETPILTSCIQTYSYSGDIKSSWNNGLENSPGERNYYWLIDYYKMNINHLFPNRKSAKERKELAKIVSEEAAKMSDGVKQKVRASAEISPETKRALNYHMNTFDRDICDIASAA